MFATAEAFKWHIMLHYVINQIFDPNILFKLFFAAHKCRHCHRFDIVQYTHDGVGQIHLCP